MGRVRTVVGHQLDVVRIPHLAAGPGHHDPRLVRPVVAEEPVE
jgi:hypothetical protein